MFKTGRKQAIFFSNNCYFFQNPYNIELTRLLHSKGYRIVFCIEKQVFPVSKEFINWKFIDWPFDLPHRIVVHKTIKECFTFFLKSVSKRRLRTIYYSGKHFAITLNSLIRKLAQGITIMFSITKQTIGYRDNLLLGIDEFGYLLLHELSLFCPGATKYFISHELYFDDEIDSNIKYLKDTAHKAITKAHLILSTDEERLNSLLNNSIHKNKLKLIDSLCIPVGYYSFHNIIKRRNDYQKNILYTGTLSSTCGVDELVNLFSINEDLSKYKIHFHSYHFYEKYQNSIFKNISFNCTPIPEASDYIKFASQFDIGLALYFPDQNVGAHFGKNINFIGYSSGKFSLLAMLSIPIICSANASFMDLNRRFKFGIIINDITEIPNALNTIYSDYQYYASESKRMYTEVLCPVEQYTALSKRL